MQFWWTSLDTRSDIFTVVCPSVNRYQFAWNTPPEESTPNTLPICIVEGYLKIMKSREQSLEVENVTMKAAEICKRSTVIITATKISPVLPELCAIAHIIFLSTGNFCWYVALGSCAAFQPWTESKSGFFH